jgi:hypothetical protein
MTANIAFYRMFRFIAKNKNMIFVYARFKLLPEFIFLSGKKLSAFRKLARV